MQARINQKGEVIVVELTGKVEIEKTQVFKEALKVHLNDRKVVFHMKDLNFVGSTGIQSFFQILREFHMDPSCKIKIAGMKPDFKKLWLYNDTSNVEIHDNLESALMSFTMPNLETI